MKTYGKPFKAKDGIVYYRTVPYWKYPIDRLSVLVQWSLWKIGIHWHNIIRDECTPDGSCCKNVNKLD